MITFVCLLYMLGTHAHFQYIRQKTARVYTQGKFEFLLINSASVAEWGFQGVGERKMVNRKELQRTYHHFSLVLVTPVLQT